MLFLVLNLLEGSETRWLTSLSAALLVPEQVLCLPLFHPFICPEIHPSNIYWAYPFVKFSDGYTREYKNSETHLKLSGT